MARKMLELETIEAGYGPAPVLFGVDMMINAGEVVTLMGRNGMGKTTTLRAIMGMTPASAGQIWFDSLDITALPSHKIARAGIGYVPEGRQIFANLTVYENLVATARQSAHSDWNLERVYELFPKLKKRHTQMGRTLSGGEQQMLAIGRALMTNPKLMILDEATEGLAPLIREEIWHTLEHDLKKAGQAILVIDKHPDAMARIADRHYVMSKGKIVWSGDSKALLSDVRMQQRYLGV